MKVSIGTVQVALWRYVGVWSIVVVAFALQRYAYDLLLAGPWPGVVYLRWSLIQWGAWAALAPTVFRLAERRPLSTPLNWPSLALHVAASLGVTLAALVAGALVSTLFEPSGFAEQFKYFVAQHAATGLLTYWALVAIHHALHYQAEKARREVEASRLATELGEIVRDVKAAA